MDLDLGLRSEDGSWIMKLINIIFDIYNLIYQKYIIIEILSEIYFELGPRSEDGAWREDVSRET